MSKKSLTRFFGAALVMSIIPLSHAFSAPVLGNSLYLEVQDELQLYVPATLSTGARALAPSVALPEESILAIDLRQLAAALNASRNSPESVKFPFITSSSSTEIQRGTEWVCGLRVVDATDEDLRETEEIERQDFCIAKEDLALVDAMISNHPEALAAFQKYADSKELTELNNIADQVERLEKERSSQLLSPINDTPINLISPLRDCGSGCLIVTSEFGMRMHPVLHKRRLHKGIDLRAKIGSSVVSVLDGSVLANRTEYGSAGGSKAKGKGKRKGKRRSSGGRQVMKGYGHYVIVMHPEQNLETLYAHLSDFRSKPGAQVQQGNLIALSGNTGIGTAPHLHFETHVPGKKGGYIPVNPRKFISNLVGTVAAFFKYFNVYI